MSKLEENHPWLYSKYIDGYFTVHRSDHPFSRLWSDLVIEQVVMASLKNSRSGLTLGRGLTESVRQQWIHSFYAYAAVHDAMSQLTERRRITSEQHDELGRARRKTDSEDVMKLCEWFISHNPFSDNPELRFLSIGLTAKGPEINCDDCENVRLALEKGLDDKPYNEGKIPRKGQIRNLKYLETGLVVDKKRLNIDCRILFSRLSSIVQRLDTTTKPFLEHGSP